VTPGSGPSAGGDPARPPTPSPQPNAPVGAPQQPHGAAVAAGPPHQHTPAAGPGQQGSGPDVVASLPDPPSPSVSPGQERARQVDDAQRQLANSTSAAHQERGRQAVDELSGHPTVDGLFGDLVAGDKTEIFNLFPGLRGTKVGAYRLPVETVSRPYVPASGFDALLSAIDDRRLIIVRGRPGTGKSAALVHALTRGADDVSVMKLDTTTDLSTLVPAQLSDCQAIVLYDLTANQLDKLDEDTVDRLSAELAAANRWLGLTITDDLPITLSVETAVVEIGDPPSPRAVFDCHLEAGLESCRAREQLVSEPAVAQLLADELTGSTTLGRAARLAQMLSPFHPVPEGLAAIVRARIDDRAHDECVQWFRTLPSTRAHCTALALAVLNGLPRAEVTAAADRLMELISPTPDRPEPGPVPNPFAPDSGVPLATLRAATRPGTLSAVEGDYRVTELRYLDPLFPAWVLRHTWDEHDSARPHVVTWLKELGGHHNQDVRTRAAAAVGVLATQAFDFVYAQIIGNWAREEDPDLRESAALALLPSSRDEELRDTVATLVQGWVGDDDRPLLQATAARTFGGDAGLTRPSNSLRQLAALAEVDHVDVAISVARSLGELVVQGTAALAGRVLTEIIRWVGGRRPELRLVGRLAFLRLTYLRGAPTPAGEKADAAFRPVPTLLVLALRDRRFVGQLTWLWMDGLNSADAHRWVRVSLTSWAEAVEKHPPARAAFVELMQAAAVDGRTAAIIVRAAQAWRSDSGNARSTAEAVLAHLTGVVTHG
jgi:hypothetical protein